MKKKQKKKDPIIDTYLLDSHTLHVPFLYKFKALLIVNQNTLTH